MKTKNTTTATVAQPQPTNEPPALREMFTPGYQVEVLQSEPLKVKVCHNGKALFYIKDGQG